MPIQYSCSRIRGHFISSKLSPFGGSKITPRGGEESKNANFPESFGMDPELLGGGIVCDEFK